MKWQSLALNAGRFQSKTQAHNDIINNCLIDLRYKGERKKHPKLENGEIYQSKPNVWGFMTSHEIFSNTVQFTAAWGNRHFPLNYKKGPSL